MAFFMGAEFNGYGVDAMKEDMRILAVSALLHDIGKLCCRADKEAGEHAFAGKLYLQKYLQSPASKAVLETVQCHHAASLLQANLPAEHIAYLVCEADTIAAGAERCSEESAQSSGADAPLESIFNRLNGVSELRLADDPNLIGTDEAAFSLQPAEKVRIDAEKYKLLLERMAHCFERSQLEQGDTSELLAVLEAVAGRVPVGINHAGSADLSLYDHSKLTAAIACALYSYFQEKKIRDYSSWCCGDQNAAFREEKAFLLAAGDFSGIQDFIYSIPSAGALKALRGRSFYLELLLEHIVDELLEGAGLSRSNLIYTGGGHFYLLLPNTEAVREILDEAQRRIDAWLLEQHGTSLYLQLAAEPCSANELMNTADKDGVKGNRTGDIFRRVSGKLSAGKASRYDEAALRQLFDPSSCYNRVLDRARECVVCHTSSRQLSPYEARPDGGEACPSCQSLYRLGQKLLSERVAFVTGETKEGGFAVPSLGNSGLYITPVTVEKAEQLAALGAVKRVYVKNEIKTNIKQAIRLRAGDYAYSTATGHVADFRELAQGSDGIERLGVLRADVDFLGAAFVAGFADSGQGKEPYEYASLSRYAALSRQLSVFFKSHINALCAGVKEPVSLFGRQRDKRRAAIVYSGGDDMFLVGAWDQLLELALELRRAFNEYTGGKLTFSAGLALFDEKYPVSQMARLTGELESAAKNFRPEKDSIALFGLDSSCLDEGPQAAAKHVYPWSVFQKEVCGEKLAFLQSKLSFGGESDPARINVGKGQLYKWLLLLDTEDDGKFNLARFAYSLARMDPGQNQPQQRREAYQQIKQKLFQWGSDPLARRQLVTAIHLMIYHKRDQQNGKGER